MILSSLVQLFILFTLLVGIHTSTIQMSKASMIQAVLNKLYPNPPVPLNYNSPFTFLCAVVLSAQTTDGKVNQVTETLFKLAPDPLAMSRMKYEDVLKIIQPVGLAPKKSEYLINLSKIIIERFGGNVPGSFEELESLPGVGHKTASVVMSQIFGHPSLAVDTHVHRLALRWRLTKNERDPSHVQKDLCAVFPQSDWSKLHLQMIYFGREYCTAKLHESSECPVCCWVNQPEDRMHRTFESVISSTTKPPSASVTGAATSSSSSSSLPVKPAAPTKSVSTKKKAASSTSTSTATEVAVDISNLPAVEKERQFTPKTPPKGIISYAARHAELSLSPELAPSLTLADFSYAESKPVAVDSKPVKKQRAAKDNSASVPAKTVGRKRAVKEEEVVSAPAEPAEPKIVKKPRRAAK